MLSKAAFQPISDLACVVQLYPSAFPKSVHVPCLPGFPQRSPKGDGVAIVPYLRGQNPAQVVPVAWLKQVVSQGLLALVTGIKTL